MEEPVFEFTSELWLYPGDAGWHIDASFGVDSPDFMSWRANIHTKGRRLLMLFLFLLLLFLLLFLLLLLHLL